MSVDVVESGLPQLVARLDHVHDGILDLSDANAELAKVVTTEADPLAPRATGQLAADTFTVIEPTGWGIGNSRPYFLPVHWGTRIMRARPWLLEAANRTADKQADLLADHVQQLYDH